MKRNANETNLFKSYIGICNDIEFFPSKTAHRLEIGHVFVNK